MNSSSSGLRMSDSATRRDSPNVKRIRKSESAAFGSEYSNSHPVVGSLDAPSPGSSENSGELLVSDFCESQILEPAGAPGTPISPLIQNSWPPWRNQYFTDWRENSNHQVFARCKLCQSDHYFSGAKSSFSNFTKHLSGIHSEVWKLEKSAHQKPRRKRSASAISAAQNLVLAANIQHSWQRKLDGDLIRVISNDHIPLDLLQRPSFRQWIQQNAVPGYRLPTAERMRHHLIPEFYQQIRDLMAAKLANCSSMTLVINIWSFQMMAFVNFSSWIVTQDFERFHCQLSIKKLDHVTSREVLDAYHQLLQDWNISENLIVRIMTDLSDHDLALSLRTKLPFWNEADEPETSGRNEALDADETTNVAAPLWRIVDHIGPELQSLVPLPDKLNELNQIGAELEHRFASNGAGPGTGKHCHINSNGGQYFLKWSLQSTCITQILQLVIRDGLEAIEGSTASAIQQASRLINQIRSCPSDGELFAKSVHFTLEDGSKIGWNAQYTLLHQWIKALEADPKLQSKFNWPPNLRRLNENQMKLLKELILILEPFGEAFEDFQTDSEVIGNIIPAYLDILNKITLTIPDESSGREITNPFCPIAHQVKQCRKFATALRNSLVKRLSFVMTDLHCVLGTVLDPRFKKSWIKASGIPESIVLDCVKSELESRYHRLCGIEKQGSVPDASGTYGSNSDPSVRRQSNRKLYSTVIESSPNRAANLNCSRIVEEFETFINEPTTPFEEPANPLNPSTSEPEPIRPLKYWKDHCRRFPILSAIAKDVLGVSASSGGVEKLLNAATDLLCARRNQIRPEFLDTLLFIKRNSHVVF